MPMARGQGGARQDRSALESPPYTPSQRPLLSIAARTRRGKTQEPRFISASKGGTTCVLKSQRSQRKLLPLNTEARRFEDTEYFFPRRRRQKMRLA